MIRVWVAGNTVCDPLITHGPYLSALAVVLPIIRRYTNNRVATDPSCLFSMTFQDLFWGVFQDFPGPYMLLYC